MRKSVYSNQQWTNFAASLQKATLIGLALLFVFFFLLAPLILVFQEAFAKGIKAYLMAISDPDTFDAIKLTLFAALFSVPLNILFGISAAWAIARFRFPGRSILMTLCELPLAVSPVIAGMMLILLYGSHGLLGDFLTHWGLKIIFAPPGIIIATTFITLPFIVRELVPLMEEQGNTEEEAALTMGASSWQMFFSVTLPNIKWGLLYGIILCNARAMGEFGAVSVVSGHIRGLTNTLPLRVEILYNEYSFSAAFAVASLLSFLAIFTLILKTVVEWKINR